MSSSVPPAWRQGTPRMMLGLFWWLLLCVGVLLRIWAIDQPIFSNSNLRQTQTAVITESIAQQPGLALGGTVKWLGDADARLLLELPLYNYLVLAVMPVAGDLDRAGKIVSVALWALSFLLLQSLWRRLCSEREGLWANYLFVIAPLSVYFGQTFQPEMLIQCLGLGFCALAFRYAEDPSGAKFAALAGVGLVGMLLKAPEISHLYLLAGWLIASRSGWKSLLRLRYAVALGFTALCMKLWGQYMDRTNAAHFPEWTSAKVMGMMLGTWWSHFDPFEYLRVLVYVVLLVATVGGLPMACGGAVTAWRERRGAVLAWLGSVVFFYVFWSGATSRIHSYYNLPALGPVCLLFGLGCSAWLKRANAGASWWRRASPVRCVIVAGTLLSAFPAGAFLFSQDPILAQVTRWLRENTDPDDIVLLRIDHRTDMAIYRHNSTVSYYARRRVWSVVERNAEQSEHAIGVSKWAVVTQPQAQVGTLEKLRRWIKRMPVSPADYSWLEEKSGFEKFYESDGFTIFRKRSANPAGH